jgi:hypothetical protein
VPGVMRKIALCIATQGTSCLATISLSLRDKSHSPIEGPGIKLALMGRVAGGRLLFLRDRDAADVLKHLHDGGIILISQARSGGR